jgi:hypothetical protein
VCNESSSKSTTRPFSPSTPLAEIPCFRPSPSFSGYPEHSSVLLVSSPFRSTSSPYDSHPAHRRLSLSKLTPSSIRGHLRHGRRLREFVYPLVIFVFAKVLVPGASSRSTSSSACLNEHIHKPWVRLRSSSTSLLVVDLCHRRGLFVKFS